MRKETGCDLTPHHIWRMGPATPRPPWQAGWKASFRTKHSELLVPLIWMVTWMYAILSNSLVINTDPPWAPPPPQCLPCSPRTTLTAWTGSLLSCRWGLPVWWLDFIHVHRLHLHSCAGRYVGHGQVAEEACGRPAQTSQDVWKDLVYDWRVLNDCKLFNKS